MTTTMTDISFHVSEMESHHVSAIVRRAKKNVPSLVDANYDAMTLRMDLCATHANGCPLDFGKLLDSDDLTFVHDVVGIARHLDRDTGRIEDGFRPRCATKKVQA